MTRSSETSSRDFSMNEFLSEIQDARKVQRDSEIIIEQPVKQAKSHPKEDLARYNQALEYASRELENLRSHIKKLRQEKLNVLVEVEDVKLRKSKSIERELDNLVMERDRLQKANQDLQSELARTKEERVSLVKQKVLLETKDSVLSRERSEAEREKEKYISYKKDLLKEQRKIDQLKSTI